MMSGRANNLQLAERLSFGIMWRFKGGFKAEAMALREITEEGSSFEVVSLPYDPTWTGFGLDLLKLSGTK